MAPSKRTVKQAERAELKKTRRITLTIEASEANIERLAAFLLFAEFPHTIEPVETGPLPYEDPNDPRFQKPKEDPIDYDVVTRSIGRQLAKYIEKHGAEKARAVIRSFGGEKVSQVPQQKLMELDAALAAALG